MTTATALWTDWIGLPHQIGADPREGKAACCLVMARILLTNVGIPFPEIEDQLLDLARAHQWTRLSKVFHEHTEPILKPEPWSLTLVENGPAGLGLGTVVPGPYLLLPHHRKGVTAIPIVVLRKLNYHRLRNLDEHPAAAP